MVEKVAVRPGPSGRRAEAASKCDLEGYCVLFDDGTIGLQRERGTLDDSGYDLVYHQASHVRLVELEKENEGTIPAVGIAILFLLLFTILYLSMRSFIDTPLGNLSSDFVAILCAAPLAWYYIFRNFISEVPVMLIHHSSNTQPYRIRFESRRVSMVELALGMSFIIGFSSWFVMGEIVSYLCDAILLVILGVLLLLEKGVPKPFFVGKGEVVVPNLDSTEFYDLTLSQIKENLDKNYSDEIALKELLLSNESPTLEFKGSMWTTYKGTSYEKVEQQTKKNLDLQDGVVKTVAAFLNSDGGTLLIGVKDKPRSAVEVLADVIGIEADFQWLPEKRRDREGYTHALIQLLNNAFGDESTVKLYIDISYHSEEDGTVCRIEVKPLPRIMNGEIYVKTNNMGAEEFFYRVSDTTTHASVKSANRYIRHHFEGFSGENNQS